MSLEKLGGISPENLAFIKKNNSEKIDNFMDDCLNSRNKLIAIASKFSEIISTMDKAKTTTHIKVHETPKSDPILLGTKRRCGLLQHWINSQDNEFTEARMLLIYSILITIHSGLSILSIKPMEKM